MRATFLGVSTILLQDDASAIMTDGFFSRPGLLKSLLRPLVSDEEIIAAALSRLGVTSLDAVFVTHSHYDHALDAPVVAQRTGADLVGSRSTGQIAAGYGLDSAKFRLAEQGQPMHYGKFEVTLLPAEHTPKGKFPGSIEHPVRPPASIRDYKEGGCFSIHVRHGDRTLLIHASTNFVPGALAGYEADTVYLGIALLAKQSAAFRDEYWREVVLQTGARRVIPIHWDAFWKPLSKPLRPLPRVVDNVQASMRYLAERGEADGVQITMPLAWEAVEPFGR